MSTLTAVSGSHIFLDEHGAAWIDHTNVKVIEVALEVIAHQSSPQEIHDQYPHLSLAQIHAALTYYYDHQEALDAKIEQDYREVKSMAARAREISPIRKRLREIGKLT
jgi:uncharacterized protein (DUF433 family)